MHIIVSIVSSVLAIKQEVKINGSKKKVFSIIIFIEVLMEKRFYSQVLEVDWVLILENPFQKFVVNWFQPI